MTKVSIADSKKALVALVGRLEEELAKVERRDGEYTIAEYAELRGITVSRAFRELERMERAGEIKFLEQKRKVKGHLVNVFVEV